MIQERKILRVVRLACSDTIGQPALFVVASEIGVGPDGADQTFIPAGLEEYAGVIETSL